MRRLVAAPVLLTGIVSVLLSAWAVAPVSAADDWIDVKSAHFAVVSNASERTTRRLVWPFEQVRSATSAIFSWAKTDLNRPLHIIIVKDENSRGFTEVLSNTIARDDHVLIGAPRAAYAKARRARAD